MTSLWPARIRAPPMWIPRRAGVIITACRVSPPRGPAGADGRRADRARHRGGRAFIAQGPGMFTTYAGRSGLAAALMVAAGPALVLAGLLASQTSRTGPAGDLAVLAGITWFAPVWVGWEADRRSCAASGCSPRDWPFPCSSTWSSRSRADGCRPRVSACWPGWCPWRPRSPRLASRSSATPTSTLSAGPTAPTTCSSSGHFRSWHER